jgi:Effector-associated domain 2
MVLVDVEKFGDPGRTDADQLQVREGMYGALKAAFRDAGIPWERCEVGDRGDGVMILVPADVSKNRLAAMLPGPLVAAIESHNAHRRPQVGIRLRMALHAGEVHRDDHGQTGDALNFAFRMLNSVAAKEALASSSGVLVVVVSESFHHNVVRHDPTASPGSYRLVRFQTKETSAGAWVWCPGDTTGAALAATNGDSSSQVDVLEDRLTKVLRGQEVEVSGNRQSALAAFVNSLLEVPTVAQEVGRRLVIDHLRPEIGNAIPYFSQSRHHVFSLVRTCMNYPGGVEELLAVVRLLEGESTPVRQLDATIAQLLAKSPQ